ncbi:hypothetical protein J4225_03240 [Candidatus Pacearchaeota archaeon]|nr:hypothetical protein [Candidatus Pacearchaeota archaeon]
MEKQTERIGIFEHEGVKYEIGIDKVMDYFREIAYGMSPYIREHPISCRGTIRISQIEPKRRFLGFSYKPTINVFDNILKEKPGIIGHCEDTSYLIKWMEDVASEKFNLEGESLKTFGKKVREMWHLGRTSDSPKGGCPVKEN